MVLPSRGADLPVSVQAKEVGKGEEPRDEAREK